MNSRKVSQCRNWDTAPRGKYQTKSLRPSNSRCVAVCIAREKHCVLLRPLCVTPISTLLFVHFCFTVREKSEAEWNHPEEFTTRCSRACVSTQFKWSDQLRIWHINEILHKGSSVLLQMEHISYTWQFPFFWYVGFRSPFFKLKVLECFKVARFVNGDIMMLKQENAHCNVVESTLMSNISLHSEALRSLLIGIKQPDYVL